MKKVAILFLMLLLFWGTGCASLSGASGSSTAAPVDGQGNEIAWRNAQGAYGDPDLRSCDKTVLERLNLASYPDAFGALPDEVWAVQAAAAVFSEVYSAENCVVNEQPFEVAFNTAANAWVVNGTLSEGTLGGVAIVALDKETGALLMISHGK